MTEAEMERCRRMTLLRKDLKISRTHFAAMIEISAMALCTKELGRVPFKNAEIAQIKARVNAHLATCVQTLSSLDV